MELKNNLFDFKQHLIDSAQSYYARQYLRPKTILANNHLDANKPIYVVKPFLLLA